MKASPSAPISADRRPDQKGQLGSDSTHTEHASRRRPFFAVSKGGEKRRVALRGAVLAVLGALALTPLACSTEQVVRDPCKGGVVDESGACAPKCDPEKCAEGNTCVGNACRLLCGSHRDCWPLVQACTPATEDDTGDAVAVCEQNGRQMPLVEIAPGEMVAAPGIGSPCPFGDGDCSLPDPNTGAPRVTACPNGLHCDPLACGGNPADCTLDEEACGDAERCNIGTCSDGSACVVTTCDPAQCQPLTCVSEGEGDANGYCAIVDCSEDADCGAGFRCGIERQPNNICGNTCDSGKCSHDAGISCTQDKHCQKGNVPLCGTTVEACIDPAEAPAHTTYQEGSVCLLRQVCQRRDECAACESHLDCSAGDASLCAAMPDGNGKACARFCNVDANCRDNQQCVPAGSTCAASPSVECATAEDCPTEGDTCVPRSACVPRSGSCFGPANGSPFCHTCVDDTDCGDKDSGFGCVDVMGTGEKVCYDFLAVTCSSDGDCPTSPSGQHGRCLNASDPIVPPDYYGRCFLPKQGANAYGCYPLVGP